MEHERRRIRGKSDAVLRDLYRLGDSHLECTGRRALGSTWSTCFIGPGDEMVLQQTARLLPPAGVFVEIGSFHGYSTSAMLTALRRRGNWAARVISVDLWMEPQATYEALAGDTTAQWSHFAAGRHATTSMQSYMATVATTRAAH